MSNKNMFVIDRVVTVKGFGHAIRFEPGAPVHVPTLLHGAVRRAGARAVDGGSGAVDDSEDMIDAQTANEAPGEGIVGDADTVPVTSNDAAVLEAFRLLVDQNDSDDFGAGNKPHVKSVEKLIGFDISSQERDALWARFRQLETSA